MITPFVNSQRYADPVRNTLGIWSRLLGRMAQQRLPSDEELHFKVDENNLLSIRDIFPEELFPTIASGFALNGVKDFGKAQKISFVWTTPIKTTPSTKTTVATTTTTTTTSPTTIYANTITEATSIAPATEEKKLRPKRKRFRRKHQNSNKADIHATSTLNEDHPSSSVTQEAPSNNQDKSSSSPSLSTASTTTALITTTRAPDETIPSLSPQASEKMTEKMVKIHNSLLKTERKIQTSSDEMLESVAEIIASEILRRIGNLKKNGTSSEHRILIKIRSLNKENDDERLSAPNNANSTNIAADESNNFIINDQFQEASINLTDPDLRDLLLIQQKARIKVAELEEYNTNATKQNNDSLHEGDLINKRNATENAEKMAYDEVGSADEDFEKESTTRTETQPVIEQRRFRCLNQIIEMKIFVSGRFLFRSTTHASFNGCRKIL